jgi:hypothetical protein
MINQSFAIEAVHYVDGGMHDLAADARARYKDELPGRATRRMTHLGMMVRLCIQKLQVVESTPVIYASAFAESESLEKFIDSFPGASPAMFQSSIHPSAVEQALIPQKSSIDRFYPITSDENLAGKALENCFLLSGDEVVLVGGEERGTWLCEHELASDVSFALGVRLSRSSGGIGRISLEKAKSTELSSGMDLVSFANAMDRRESIRIPSYALDAWICIDWS